MICALVSNMMFATKIVQTAKVHHLPAYNTDRAESLAKQAKLNKTSLLILDLDGLEAESFNFLKTRSWDADLKSIACVGYVSQTKRVVKEEAERAGCLKVYLKTEFLKVLDDLFVRYAK